jgi:hypothetical protein
MAGAKTAFLSSIRRAAQSQAKLPHRLEQSAMDR